MASSNGESVHSVTDLSHGQDWCSPKSSLEQWLTKIIGSAQVRQVGADLQQWAAEHPLLAAGAVTILALGIFPVLTFMVFAAFTTTVAAVGFLMLEGFLLLLACWVLVATLTGIAIGAVCTLSFVGTAWYLLSATYRLVSNIIGVPGAATVNTKKTS